MRKNLILKNLNCHTFFHFCAFSAFILAIPATNPLTIHTYLHAGDFLIDALYGKPHDIEITALQSGASDIADPFLNAVGSCLVEWLVMRDVITDFCITELLERHLGNDREMALLAAGGQAYACYHMVGLAAQHPEHANGILFILRFSENYALSLLIVLLVSSWGNHNGIGCENKRLDCLLTLDRKSVV